MTANQEVTIKIDDKFTGPVCDYSVGFLKFRRESNIEFADPAGTGTFVKLGRVYGILTAAHVLRDLEPKETVGLVRFPSIVKDLQNARLDLQDTERLVEWNGKDGDAPDIAFPRIPEVEARNLEALGAIFYNLGIAREFTTSEPGHRMSKCYAIVGVVGEWTEEGLVTSMKKKKVVIGGLFGAAKNLRELEECETALVEAEIDHAAGPRIPKSYGGVSGSALWELHVELDKDLMVAKVNKRLHGVAFRQSDDRTHITSNATPSIDAIVKKITEKWPEATQ